MSEQWLRHVATRIRTLLGPTAMSLAIAVLVVACKSGGSSGY